MIDDEGIARLGRIAEAPPDLVYLRRQRPDMERLRNALRHHAPGAVEDREGEVLAFLDDGRIARAQHVERELTRDLQRGLMDDFEVDGVHWLNLVILRDVGWVKSRRTIVSAGHGACARFCPRGNWCRAPLPTLRPHFTGY